MEKERSDEGVGAHDIFDGVQLAWKAEYRPGAHDGYLY